MSDANTPATSAPSAPAAAPASPTTAAPTAQAPTTQKTHHAVAQPRTPEGKFNGPPDPAKVPTGAPAPEAAPPPPPKSWKVGGREFRDPDELAAFTAERDAEARAVEVAAQRLREYEARMADYEAKLKDPTKALTPEQEQAILQRRVREWQEQDALSRMTPEARADYLARKEIQREVETLRAEKAERARLEAEAKQKAEAEAQQAADLEARKELADTLTEAVRLAGLDPTDHWHLQKAAWIMHGAAVRPIPVVYPPHVVARKVREEVEKERRGNLAKADLPSLLKSDPGLVERLNAIEDPEVLRALGALGEKLRRLNLEALGARPAVVPNAVATGATGPSNPQRYPPGDPRWQEERERRIRGG